MDATTCTCPAEDTGGEHMSHCNLAVSEFTTAEMRIIAAMLRGEAPTADTKCINTVLAHVDAAAAE